MHFSNEWHTCNVFVLLLQMLLPGYPNHAGMWTGQIPLNRQYRLLWVVEFKRILRTAKKEGYHGFVSLGTAYYLLHDGADMSQLPMVPPTPNNSSFPYVNL